MDVLNLGSNERIDYADFKFGVSDSPMGFHSALVGNVLCAQSGQRVSILSGFVASSPGANLVAVSLGRALGAYRKGAVVQYGVVVAQGDAQKTLDVTALTAGTYNVYVRFNYVEGSQYNRVFWAASSGGYEYAQAQNTRLLANWDMAVELASPGPEWIQVATVVLPAMTFTDTRPLYFEGRPDQGYPSSWGGGNDRSANRAQYGIGDWQTFANAMRTCLEDLKGPGLRKWYDPVIGGQNIGFAGTPAASRTAWGDANFYAQGSTTVPGVTFDTGDSVTYDRANNRWSFSVGASATALLGGGLSLGTYAAAATAAPTGGLLASGAVGIGTSTVGANALAVAGSTALTGTLSVSGASTLAAVTATTGGFSSNVTVSGTFGASGAATLSSTLNVTGASTLAAVTATTGGFSSNVTVGGTLGVTGATTLAALSAGAATLTSTLSVAGASTLAALTTTGLVSVGNNVLLTGSGRSLVVNGSAPTSFSLPGAGGVSCIETFGATLASTSGAAQIHQTWQVPDGNSCQLQIFNYRNAAGSSFATADSYLSKRVEASFHGFLAFYSISGVAGQNGVGLGVGAAGTTPNLLAYASNTIVNTQLNPGTANAYGLGSSSLPWSTVYAGAVVTGSRVLAIRGWVAASTLASNGTYPAQNYMPGATPGFVSVYFVADTPGSLAGFSVKPYNNAGTGGTLTLSTNGATSNPSSAALTTTQVNNAYSQKFTPGQYPFAAGAQIVVQVTSASWVQATAGASGVEMTLYVYQ